MTERQTNEALERLNRGIQESRQMVQEQTMKLAQDYFGDSVEGIKQEIKESRDTLEGLPEQIPGGQDEAFQALFQELMDNYAAIEAALDEAQSTVANLDTERLRRQGEVNASEAARREARELGVDLTQVEGTGSGGMITIMDVTEFAEEAGGAAEETGQGADGTTGAAGEAEDGAAGRNGSEEGPQATNAARRKAEELGVDLSNVQGSGAGGLITIKDVVQA